MGVRNLERQYYEAYDDRYRQVHADGLQWFADEPTPIVMDVIRKFSIRQEQKLLEIGCGEGRDAYPLLKAGFHLLATDISGEAIRYNKERYPEFRNRFAVLDCISGEIPELFDFIYAVAVLHMLLEDSHRDAFYRFIRNHLSPDGIALICSMGDGEIQRSSDITAAFDLQERTHEHTGREVKIAATSCRMVNFDTLHAELTRNGLEILQEGITESFPDFSMLMYVVVKGTKL